MANLLDLLMGTKGGWNPDVPQAGVRPGYGLGTAEAIMPPVRSPYQRTLDPGETRTPSQLQEMLAEVILAAGSAAVPAAGPRGQARRAPGNRRPSYEVSGESLGTVFHGGKEKIRRINPDRLQYRDPGFYGRGFYVTQEPSYAKSYGSKMTRMTVDSTARVLKAELTPEKSDPGLVSAVKEHILQTGLPKAEARGKADAFRAEVEAITENPLNWKNAVDRYAEDNGFHVVSFGRGEIVVKDPSKVRIAE